MSDRTLKVGATRKVHRKGPSGLSEEQKSEIKEAFDIFDSDKNGKIDRKELIVCIKAMNLKATKEDINEAFNEYDPQGKGFLDFNGFQNFVGEKIKARDPIEDAKKSYSLFKENGKGNINLSDLRRISKEMDMGLTEVELQEMIEIFDIDNDGEISEAEFMKIMNIE